MSSSSKKNAAQVQLSIAKQYQKDDRLDEAIEAYLEAIKLEPTEDRLYFLMSSVYYQNQRNNSLKSIFTGYSDKILEINADLNIAQQQMIRVLQKEDKFIANYCLVAQTPQSKVLYCRVPKNANSLFTNIMLQISECYSGWKKSKSTLTAYICELNQQDSASLYSLSYVRNKNFSEKIKALYSPEYFKFAVLRNPFKRLVSGYLDKFVSSKLNRSSIPAIQNVYDFMGVEANFEKSITFSQFVDYVSRTEDRELDLHYYPQYKFLGWGLFDFDFIGKFEDLSSVIRDLEERFGVKLETRVTGEKHLTKYGEFTSNNEAFHDLYPEELRQLEGLPKSSNLYTPELEELVKIRYAEDIKIYEQLFNIVCKP